MKINLEIEIPSKESIRVTGSPVPFFIIALVLIVMIGSFIVFVAASNRLYAMAFGIFTGMMIYCAIIIIGIAPIIFEPIITSLFFIERSFKVYEYTIKAEFSFKNKQSYLALVNINNIEIYDVKRGDIIVNLEKEADTDNILFSPLTILRTFFKTS